MPTKFCINWRKSWFASKQLVPACGLKKRPAGVTMPHYFQAACGGRTREETMQAYQDLMRHVLANGTDKADRTGTGTRSVFGYQMRFDLSEGFPLLTTKKLHLRSIIHELLWFLRGDTNIQYLKDNNVSIWDEWADEEGNLGPVYGYQWRSWPAPDGRHIDQIANVVAQIKQTPIRAA